MRKNTANHAADLDSANLLENQLGLELSRIDEAVVFMNLEGIATEISVDNLKHILKRKFMSEFAISEIKDNLSNKLLGNTDSVCIESTALLSLLVDPVSGELVPSSANEAKIQRTDALRILVSDSELTLVPDINEGH